MSAKHLLSNIFDPYTRRARLQPALLVALPVAIAVLAWFPQGLIGLGFSWSIFVWTGGTSLLSQVARDRGKRKEPELFRLWGGRPTTRLLRHRNAPNTVLLERRHGKLTVLLSGRTFPTASEEEADPDMADAIYDAGTTFLLEQTRDRKRFPLIFEENCNYGFRRNLWGMKPIGITIAVTGSMAIVVLLALRIFQGASLPPIAIVCAISDLMLLIGWVTWFTPNWVKIAADAYAERLLAACEVL